MSRRRRFLLWAGMLVAFGVGLVGVALSIRSEGPITFERIRGIKKGMALQEIEILLGVPPGDYGRGDIISYPRVAVHRQKAFVQ